MAERAEALVLQMSADITKMQKALDRIAGETNRQLGRTEQRFDKLNAHVKRAGDQMARDLRSAFATIGVSLAIREVTQAADKWTNLRNSVAQYTGVLGPTEQAMSRLLGVANDAGVAVTSLGTTFAASARAAKTLGASSAEVFAFNEAVAKGAQIANTGAAAVDGALVQLGQAIGSPKVQLGEFNSVIEGTPRLAQAFADGITDAGGSVAKLRELISKGEISGGDLFRGLLDQLPVLKREFAASEATISRSMNKLNNAFLQYVGNADKATNGTRILNGFIGIVADNFDLLADAAIVAAAAIGGTLAVQAIGRFIVAIKTAREDAKRAGREFLVLRTAMSFLGGPWGAAVIGIAAALGTMAVSAADTSVSVEDLNNDLAKFQEMVDKSQTLTDELRAAQERLNKAIETQGAVAQNAARRQVQGIEQQIAAHDKLIERERISLKARFDELQGQNRPRSAIEAALDGPGIEPTIGDKRSKLFGPDGIQQLIGGKGIDETRAEYLTRARDYLNSIQGRVMTQMEQEFDKWISDVELFDEQLLSIQNQIADIERVLKISPESRAAREQLDIDIGGIRGEAPSISDGGSDGGARARGYQTSLETLRATLEGIGTAADADAKIFNQAAMSLDVLLDLRERWEKYGAFNKETGSRIAPPGFTGTMDPGDPAPEGAISIEEWQALMEQTAQEDLARMDEITSALDANAAQRSREVLQALLQYMDSTSVRAAFDQLPSLSNMLLGDDLEIFRTEAAKRMQAVADSLATGIRKLEIERDAAIKVASQAMADALGFDQAGFDAMSASARRGLDGAADIYLDAIRQAWDDFNAGVADIVADGFTLDLSTPSLDTGDRMGDLVDQINAIGDRNQAGWVRQGIFPSEAQEEFRQLMRDSVKSAMREGIRTGDWDDAFKSILADAVTSGLEGALNRVGDWLADFLFAPDGFLGGLINGAGAWVGSTIFGGARAAGGPVSAGKIHLVGERGPELFMPSHSGKIINASETNRMLGSIGGGGGGVVVNLNVAGSIDSVTWPKVEAALQATSARLMSAMPTAVRGTIIHDRKQKRRY